MISITASIRPNMSAAAETSHIKGEKTKYKNLSGKTNIIPKNLVLEKPEKMFSLFDIQFGLILKLD